MDSNCQNGQNRRNAIWGIFYCEKRQKAVKNKVFEKNNCGGVCVGFNEKFEENVLVVVVAAIYFVEVPEEVLLKMTKGKLEKRLKNQFLGVCVTSIISFN